MNVETTQSFHQQLSDVLNRPNIKKLLDNGKSIQWQFNSVEQTDTIRQQAFEKLNEEGYLVEILTDGLDGYKISKKLKA